MLLSANGETGRPHGAYPRTVRYCDVCHGYEPHDLRPDGVCCVECAALALTRDLNRD